MQLSLILQSAGFLHAARMRRFLQFVVEETLAGRAGQLCEYSIGVSVFDRAASFEPALDPIVRNDARRLRQKLFEYYARAPHPGAIDPVLIKIPKGAYVPVLSKASCPGTMPDARYRLTISLLRINDGVEVWETQQEIPGEQLGSGLFIKLPPP